MDAFLLNNDKESGMKADKTQMDAAKQGVVTPEMAAVAASEYLSPEFIRDGVAAGTVDDFAALASEFGVVLGVTGATIEEIYASMVEKDGHYQDLEHVVAYLVTYHRLPANYITKSEAQRLGWVASKGNLSAVAPGCSIGGDRFGNYEGILPKGSYTECDIDFTGPTRNAKRVIFDSKGNIYYTEDHYQTFTRVYPAEQE